MMKQSPQTPIPLSPSSRCFVFRGAEILIPPGADLRRLLEGVSADKVRAAFKPEEIEYLEVPLLDRSAAVPCFSLYRCVLPPPGWESVSLRALVSGGVPEAAAEAVPYCGAGPSALSTVFRACHVMQWLSDSVFCGSCGSRNKIPTPELARVCPVCGRVEYPRLSPAIIVRICNRDGEILLAHDRKFVGNIYSLIAGFCEAGERLEDTVEREVFEEVGLGVRNIRYVGSQGWPFPNSLMIGFAADHSGGEIRCDGVEIEDARWFGRDSLPELPGHGSISRFMIEEWRAG